jgi:hypothetical protein
MQPSEQSETLKLGEIANRNVGSGLKSLFKDPFKNTKYDEKQLMNSWHEYLRMQYFGVSLVIPLSSLATRSKDLEYIMYPTSPGMELVVSSRYDGNEELFMTEVWYNLTVSLILTLIGLANCYLVLKFNWWRAQASVINTIIVCVSYLPFFYTYPDFEYAMFFVVVHILHSLIMWFNTENIFQMLISILIVYAWDLFQLTFRLLDFDGLDFQKFNILGFAFINLFSNLIFTFVIHNMQKKKFI